MLKQPTRCHFPRGGVFHPGGHVATCPPFFVGRDTAGGMSQHCIPILETLLWQGFQSHAISWLLGRIIRLGLCRMSPPHFCGPECTNFPIHLMDHKITPVASPAPLWHHRGRLTGDPNPSSLCGYRHSLEGPVSGAQKAFSEPIQIPMPRYQWRPANATGKNQKRTRP